MNEQLSPSLPGMARKAKPFATRYLLAAASCFAFSGCGGGTSGNAAPQAASSPGQQTQQTQRALAGQSLSGVQAAGLVLNYGSGASGPTALAYKRAFIRSAARTVSAAYRSGSSSTMSIASPAPVVFGACSSGIESASIAVSSTEEQAYLKIFYDQSCTNLFESSFFDVVATSTSSATANGNLTEYTTSAAITSYQTLQLSLTGIGTSSGTFSVLATDAANQTAFQLASLGLACKVASSAIGCGFGAVVHSATLSLDQGESLTMNVSQTSANNTITVPITANASGYTGALNALSLAAGTFPAWTISGGTTVDTASLSGQIVYNTLGLPLSGSLTSTDTADNATAVLTFNGSQMSGVITQTSTGATVATFTVNQYGSGTITYANGTTGIISQWHVLS